VKGVKEVKTSRSQADVTSDELLVAAARYVLDQMPSWELSGLANRLLNLGLTFRAVVDLATIRELTMADAGPLFERILQDASVTKPSREEAMWIVLRSYIEAIAVGSVGPREGLGLMMNVYHRSDLSRSGEYVGDSHDVVQLVGAYWAYDDIDEAARVVTFRKEGEERAKLDAVVIQRAQEWLGRHSV
jgi:hypothetical protein